MFLQERQQSVVNGIHSRVCQPDIKQRLTDVDVKSIKTRIMSGL
jgi:hypothetical protein